MIVTITTTITMAKIMIVIQESSIEPRVVSADHSIPDPLQYYPYFYLSVISLICS